MSAISETEIKQARHPHELFLINLITNHILVFVALLGMASHNPEPLILVPIISVSILGYTIWRARKSVQRDSWFVMCHWQLAAKRSRLFIARALLQQADLLAFDESFAALDPENLDRALRTVLERASTVLVIAHP